MRILVLSQWFDPEPTPKGLSFAIELRNQGHEVEVLTGVPNYPEGKIYPGYRNKLYQSETMHGIKLHRVGLYPNHDGSATRRILNYVSFATTATIFGPWRVEKPDVIYCYHPPVTTALVALAFRFFRGVPFVLDVQDLWPDTLSATGMVKPGPVTAAVALFCRLVYRFAGRIVVLSPGFKKRLEDRGVPSTKVSIIYNWADDSHLLTRPIKPDERLKNKFNVMFAGTMGKAQALDAVIGAAERLRHQPDIQWVFVGGGIERDRLHLRAKEKNLTNVLFLPRVPVTEIGATLGQASVLLVHLKNNPLFEITIPSKIQAYLASGKPCLVAVRGDAAELILRARAGITCAPEDSVALAETVASLAAKPAAEIERWGKNGLDFYQRELALSVGVEKLIAVLKTLRPRSTVSVFAQRLFDLLFVLLAACVVIPICGGLAVVVRIKLGGPVFFRQRRTGLYGAPFEIFKFRSMTDDRDSHGGLKSDGERLTPLGKFLRKYSLDELPQLWNVLKGDLSLVGPRPLLLQYLPRYTPEQARRLDVKPGITGWAQVHGRNAISWEERFKLDVYYVDNYSLLLYFKVLWMTLFKTLRPEGISQTGHETMSEFMGSKT
jgi:lipopolysaccharide/colanic/teichoic acid biosynthesis glycosyltransferase